MTEETKPSDVYQFGFNQIEPEGFDPPAIMTEEEFRKLHDATIHCGVNPQYGPGFRVRMRVQTGAMEGQWLLKTYVCQIRYQGQECHLFDIRRIQVEEKKP